MNAILVPSQPTVLSAARRVLRVLIPVNVSLGVLILALLIASLIDERTVFTALGASASLGNRALTAGMRGIMIIGIVAVACAHRVLKRLLEIVETVRTDDPFASENAKRLKEIAWAVLGLEVLRAINALVAANVSTPATTIDIGWSLDFTRWLTVLLLFVLARVFEHGTRMRDDLEGTV
jgi:hypothetical protein